MISRNDNIILQQKFSQKVLLQKLTKGIQSSDFLLSDEHATHRLVGLRYDSKTMQEPEITIICSRNEMAAAKQIAFSLGKRIYPKNDFSAMLFHNYYTGQKIMVQDYSEAAKIYADYFCAMKKSFYKV